MSDGERVPSTRRIIGHGIGGLIVVSAVIASLWVYRLNFVNPRTDDAAVRANVVGIAPQVSGPIVTLRVVDNQHVKEGELLFVIDCRPYEARLDRARADLAIVLKEVEAQRKAIAAGASEIERREASLAAATAELEGRETQPPLVDAEIARAEEERAAAEAAVARLEAEAAYAEDYLHRVEPLLKREFITADRVADARRQRDASAAAVQEARRRVRAAEAAIREARVRKRAAEAAVQQGTASRRDAAHAVEQSRHELSRSENLLAQNGDRNARLQAAEATVHAAELDVGYCRVSAPFDAYVTNLNIAVGEYARQGQQVFALVDNRAWYVLANFPETYMPSIKPGMEADVYLLTHPGRHFRGIVQGIGWANRPDDGATTGVLPDVRRTLNWVRLANRFQVRVQIEERDPDRPFRMGATAVITIRGFPSAASAAARSR
jgi:membrane fusion protein, multidrug efflux system